MLVTINKDILSVKDGIICHQISCKHAMGKGLAGLIANAYPEAKSQYMQACSLDMLGKAQLVQVSDSLIVANIFGQRDFKRNCRKFVDNPKTPRFTIYKAVKSAFLEIKYYMHSHNIENLYIPYNMGCSNAGGSWTKIERIIYNIFEKDTNVFICKKTFHSDIAIHPAEFIKEIAEEIQADLSKYDLDNITDVIAKQLEIALHIPAHILIGLQEEYDYVNKSIIKRKLN